MDTQLEHNIMRRVHRMYYLKKAFNPIMFKVYALAVAGAGIFSLVSVSNIVANMPPLVDVAGWYHFTQSAFLNTELSVQLVTAVALIAVALLVRDTLRNLTAFPRGVRVEM